MRLKKRVKENVIETYLVRRVREEFPTAEIRKFEIQKGDPDRLFLLPGARAIFVECKRPGESPRPDQFRALARLQNLGFEACWVSTKEEVDKLMARIKRCAT